MMHRERAHVDAVQTRADQLRPIFCEDSHIVFNRYRPPVHPTSGGEIETFEVFFARLIPDAAERNWYWHWLAHKARRPWVPMVGVIMVAEEFGTGRGTLFEILELLFGKDYVVPCTFGELTGTSAAARFNARLADALFAVVNEAIAEDGHQQTQRRLHYDALKNVIDPSPTQRRRYEAKQQHAYAQRAAMSVVIATQHRDVVKLPPDDRRVEVLICGRKMTPAERTEIRAWMEVPENIGALHRALLATQAVPLDVFDPFGDPPPFAGRLEMIGMGRSKLEDAYDAAIEALEGCPLFTMPQAQRLYCRRRVRRRGRFGAGAVHGRQERLPAAPAGRAGQPYSIPQAAGGHLRAHRARALALARGRHGADRQAARAGGGADRAGDQRGARRACRPPAGAARRPLAEKRRVTARAWTVDIVWPVFGAPQGLVGVWFLKMNVHVHNYTPYCYRDWIRE